MKRAWWYLAILLLLSCTAALAQEPDVMPQLVVNARYVYVTTYDGPYWSPNVIPEDRRAAGDVEEALRAWGKYMVVPRAEEADLIFVVQARPSEDTLAVYRGRPVLSSIPLWRGMQKGGLDSKELPLVAKFRKAVEAAENRTR